MSDPEEDWLDRVQAEANDNPEFASASRWLDVTMVVAFGDQPYWFKIYRGRIIDAMPYDAATNMLGYDVIVTGDTETWRRVVAGETTFARESATGQVALDGNRVEAERSYKALLVLGGNVLPACSLPPNVTSHAEG